MSIKSFVSKAKKVVLAGSAFAVGSVASADPTAITGALDTIKTDVTATTGATIGPVIAIIGIIFGAVVTVAVVKRMLYGAK